MASFRLPRLPVNWKEQPQLFERYWDETLQQIEKTLNAILDIPVIQAAVEEAKQAAVNAQSAAESAQTAAETAQGAADTANDNAGSANDNAIAAAKEASLVNSYINGYTGSLLTANAVGTVVIKPHTRVYGDSTMNPSVAVNGGTFATGGIDGEVIRVFYDDPARAGGAVTYQFVIDGDVIQGGNRHSVGAVSVPATGSNNGKGIRPPGYVEL